MNNFVTTNIRIAEDDYLRLKEEAARKRVSLAAVIREKVSGEKFSAEEYIKKLSNLKTDWFSENDNKYYKKMRANIKKRLKKYNW